MVTPRATPNAFNGKTYLGFEQLTHVPIQASMLKASLLTTAEVQWIDAYHARVWERVSPRMESDSPGAAWLRKATRPLAEQDLADWSSFLPASVA